MEKIREFLRKLGLLGSFLGVLLSVVTTNWAVAVSAILSAAMIGFGWAHSFISNPDTQLGAGLFLFFLWSYIGIRLVATQSTTRKVRVVNDLAYSLILEGLGILYNKDMALPLAFTFSFRNLYYEPIRFELQSLRVVILDRTVPDSPHPPAMVIPRLAVKGIRTGGFRKDALPVNGAEPVKGLLEFTIFYGPHNEPYQRRFSMKINIVIGFSAEGTLMFSDEFGQDSDVPI